MAVTDKNLLDVISGAWSKIKDDKDVKTADRRKQSRAWVDALAGQFQANYECSSHRVFWRDNTDNQKHFRLNELLFDIFVCSVDETNSFQQPSKGLQFVSECHWQIECEFDYGNSRSAIIDMSKLVMGSATNKLMIASHREDPDRVLEQCKPIAKSCTGNVYFCFVAHPEKWGQSPLAPSLHLWTGEKWKPMDVQKPSA